MIVSANSLTCGIKTGMPWPRLSDLDTELPYKLHWTTRRRLQGACSEVDVVRSEIYYVKKSQLCCRYESSQLNGPSWDSGDCMPNRHRDVPHTDRGALHTHTKILISVLTPRTGCKSTADCA